MKKPSLLAIFGTCFFLCSCATGYQSISSPSGMFGGYWDAKGAGKLINVGFAGNGFIEKNKVAQYITYRSAEVAQREGVEFFKMYRSIPAAVLDKYEDSQRVTSVTGKPLGNVYILLLSKNEPGAMSASEIISRLKPELGIEQK